MKSLIGLLLTLSMALPACSADDGSTPATEPVAAVETTETTVSPAAVETPPLTANASEPPVVAQVSAPVATPSITAPAPRSDIVAGRHYRVLTPTQPTSSSPDKIEVAEVFMYSCPHCKDFEPFLDGYLQSKPNYISFVRIPANFNQMARLHSKAYYMAETLGILDEIHMDFFDEFHTRGNKLASEKAIIDFFVAQGVSRPEVTGAYNSFAVDTKVRQADSLVGRRYRIDSVPALVINGKYVTSASMVGNFGKLREVVDYLTAKEAAQL